MSTSRSRKPSTEASSSPVEVSKDATSSAPDAAGETPRKRPNKSKAMPKPKALPSARTNTSSDSSESGAESADDDEEPASSELYHARLQRARVSNRARGASASGGPKLDDEAGSFHALGRLELPDNTVAEPRPRHARVAPV